MVWGPPCLFPHVGLNPGCATGSQNVRFCSYFKIILKLFLPFPLALYSFFFFFFFLDFPPQSNLFLGSSSSGIFCFMASRLENRRKEFLRLNLYPCLSCMIHRKFPWKTQFYHHQWKKAVSLKTVIASQMVQGYNLQCHFPSSKVGWISCLLLSKILGW